MQAVSLGLTCSITWTSSVTTKYCRATLALRPYSLDCKPLNQEFALVNSIQIAEEVSHSYHLDLLITLPDGIIYHQREEKFAAPPWSLSLLMATNSVGQLYLGCYTSCPVTSKGFEIKSTQAYRCAMSFHKFRGTARFMPCRTAPRRVCLQPFPKQTSCG